MVELLTGLRAEISQRRMQAKSVVEPFNVIEQTRPGFVSGLIETTMHVLTFQGAEETLHRCIIIPGPHPVHAGQDTAILQHGLVPTVRVLAPLIRMMHEACCRPALTDSHLQGSQRQVCSHPVRHGPADDSTTEQVQNGCQVEPPFQAGDVGDVGQPLLIRSVGQSPVSAGSELPCGPCRAWL